MIQAAFSRLPANGRRFLFVAAALFVVSAQPGTAETVWKKDNDFVRIEKADGSGASPSTLPKLSADAVRAILASVQVTGDGETGPLFDNEQLSLLAGPVATALAEAGPGQDVAFAVHGRRDFVDYFGPPRSTAGRIYLDGDTVGLILGMVKGSYLSSTLGVDPSRIRTGSRMAAQETEHRILPGGAVSLPVAGRSDWAKISSLAWTGTYGMPMVQAPVAPAAPAAAAAAPAMAPAAPAAAPAPASPALATAPAPQDPNQIEQRFAALKRLLDNHMISQEEYDRAKADLLKAMSSLPAH